MKQSRLKLFVKMAVTAVVFVISAWIVLSGGYPDAHLKWAFGMIGVIVGYWLK